MKTNEAVVDAGKLALCNDLNSVYGNTNSARVEHLWSLGYRKAQAADTSAALADLIAAARDVESSLDPEWAEDNVCTETAVETLIAALARFGAQP